MFIQYLFSTFSGYLDWLWGRQIRSGSCCQGVCSQRGDLDHSRSFNKKQVSALACSLDMGWKSSTWCTHFVWSWWRKKKKNFCKTPSLGISRAILGGLARLFWCGAEQPGIGFKWQFSYLGYFKVLSSALQSNELNTGSEKLCMLMEKAIMLLDSSSNGTVEIRGSFIDIGQDLELILAPFENCHGIFKLHLDGHCV